MAWFREREDSGDRRVRRYSSSRSGGGITVFLIGLALLGFGALWHAHQRAKFHQFTAPIIPQTTSAPMPGGQEAILLSRVALVNGAEPEFVSATVLPGIGMQLLQAAVAVPDQSSQNLLTSVSVSDAARISPSEVTSAPFHLWVSTRHLHDKNDGADDLIGLTPASDVKNQTLVDGGQATGSFGSATPKNGVSATLDVTLSGRQIDMVARVTNHSEESRYVAFDWSPRFAAPDGNLDRLRLYVPSHSAPEEQGKAGGAVRFATPDGDAVGQRSFDQRFTLLGHDFLSDGTYIRLQYADRFFLRILGLGDTLRSVRAASDSASHTLLLNLSSMDEGAQAEQHDQTLRPGQTMQWHLRLEVLPVKTTSTPDFSH